MDATSALACPHEFVVSIPNPFPVEHCVALLSLALVYAWWVRIRPTPIPGMRALVIAAAPSCVGVMLGLSAGAYDMEDVNDTLGFGLSAASVVTVALLVELLCHAPSPIARAVARRHRRKPLTRENLSAHVGAAAEAMDSTPAVEMSPRTSTEDRRIDFMAARGLHVAVTTGLVAGLAQLTDAAVFNWSVCTALVGIGHMAFDLSRAKAAGRVDLDRTCSSQRRPTLPTTARPSSLAPSRQADNVVDADPPLSP